MKKLQKFLALAVLAPMLAACAPSNEDVCQHLMDLMKKDMGDAAPEADAEEATKEMMKKCVEELDKEKEKSGAAEHKKQAKCVMAAEKLEDVAKCKPEEKAE